MKRALLSAIVFLSPVALCGCTSGADDGEKYLPQIHFSAASGWTGEPSGLIFYEGEYHLFYQHNPLEATYGDVGWGHATSKDLVRWQILPLSNGPGGAWHPDSGSMIVDTGNTSGLAEGPDAPFIAFYTDQSPDMPPGIYMAYSRDRGANWTPQDAPVLPENDGVRLKYPHVSRSEEFGVWIMTVSTGSSLLFYTSADCRGWEYRSEFQYEEVIPNTWEGSDLFPLRVEGRDLRKWVLTIDMVGNGPADGAPATRCFVGDFDGTSFRPTQTRDLWLDYGRDNYAGATFSGLADNDRIRLGWMNCWEYANLLPTQLWRGSMTFPRRLSLVEDGGYFYPVSVPVAIPAGYVKRERTFVSSPTALSSDSPVKFDLPRRPLELSLTFDNRDNMAIWKARDWGVSFVTRSGRRLTVGYRNEMSYYYIDRSEMNSGEPFSDTFGSLMGAAYKPRGASSDWRLLLDGSSIELFADSGRVAMTALCYPDEEFTSFEIFALGGSVTLTEARAIELKIN